MAKIYKKRGVGSVGIILIKNKIDYTLKKGSIEDFTKSSIE
jgi:hypothetical protein